jgi:2-polyprenyl-6-methoxyphenol hydroxylase-like FAD-dependent oxidoreductase
MDADVLIIGAGPVGLLLANLLGARGVRTLVCDRRTEPLTSSMAIGVTPPSLEILRALALDTVFRDAGVPVRHAEVYEARTRVGRLDFAGIASDYPYFLSIPQARTVEILRDSLGRFPSVTVRGGLEFVSLQQNSAEIRVTARDRTEHELTLRASFLVGADGHRSAVREAVGLRVSEHVYPQRFIMADFYDRTGLGSEARLFFSSAASVESFPLPGGWRRWIVLATESGNDDPAGYMVRQVERLAGYDLEGEPARFISVFGAKRMVADRFHAGRVLLAGDAAHVMSSIGGQGMNTGFADAEMLAALLPRVLRQASEQAHCFAAYDHVRRRAFEVAARRAERGMWLGTMRGRAASWFRRCFIGGVLFSPMMKPRLAPHFAMLTIPYRNLNHVPRELLACD